MGLRSSLKVLMVLGISLVAVSAANAGEMYVTPSVTYIDDDTKRAADDVVGGQIAVGWKLSDRLFAEGLLGYADMPGYFQDIGTTELSANMLFSLGPETRLSPYVLAGTGIMRTTSNVLESETSAIANLGIGVMYGFGEGPLSLRLEWRSRFELFNTITHTDQIASLALQYAFGKEAYVMPIPEPVERDADADEVLDNDDVCQRTPTGQSVNTRGCPRDSDDDSVADDLDSCQNTPRGAIVDASGCEPDNDHDSVPNHLDRCPATSTGLRVDSKGCEIPAVIELSGVSFESNSDQLLPGAESVIIDAAATLRLNQDFIVEVAGYTDSSGAAEYNLVLSKSRANTVLNYLITYGANPASLSARGYGEAEPIADNTTAEGRVANRRVELRILNR